MNEFITLLVCLITIGATKIDLNNNGYYWRDWNEIDFTPVDAVYGGIDREGRRTYIIKKVYPRDGWSVSQNKSWFEFGNVHNVSLGEVQILCSFSQHRLKWVPTKSDDHVNKVKQVGVMIRGGFDNLRPVVIGRKVYGAEVIVGNVIISHTTQKFLELRLTKDGNSLEEKGNFEVLVYDSESEDCQKVYIMLPETTT